MNVWHARLGHIGQHEMQGLANQGFWLGIPHVNLSICKCCIAGKFTGKPLGEATRAESPL